ncbi:MAG TPA: porphobilinogen synthase [Chthoniobacterales bacterium]|nr:porphobilinogen synthase [Chthoniobacterales bacterium]
MHPDLDLLRRPRRLRSSETLRQLVREVTLEPWQCIYPVFVSEKVNGQTPIQSMPGIFQFDIEHLVAEAKAAYSEGIRAILVFGIPAAKDDVASGAYASDGIVQRTVRRLKQEIPDLIVITDVCLCEYMEHGHCGVVQQSNGRYEIVNDPSVELIARTAVSLAGAGADIVAPSDMMDGRVAVIRRELDHRGFQSIPIMSYAAKFCSAFYGPFREAAESAPHFGDRRSYQMDSANANEALREVALDLEEGADLLIVKPGLPYLDILWRVKERFKMPTAVYNISGEYAMLKAAAENGWLDEKNAVLEMMTSFRRAGADLIITYWARDIAKWIG